MDSNEKILKELNLPDSVTVNLDVFKQIKAFNPMALDPAVAQQSSTKTITHVDPKEAEIFKFFSEATPCWFSGCEELRKEYFTELANLGPNCPACQKGSIIRKYKPKVEELINKHNETNNRP